MRKEVESALDMIKHSFVEGTYRRIDMKTGEDKVITADMCLEPIIKDLELLEILKSDCRLDGMLYYPNHAFISEIPKEEYQKIKEWLKNE